MTAEPTTERDRVAMGLYLERADRTEAIRIAHATERTPTQILRMAISAGLPLIAARLLGENGEDAA